MDVSVEELDVSEFELAGDMVSLFDPPRYWKVVVDNVIHCVCVSEEHAGAIADGIKSDKFLKSHLDLKLEQYELWAQGVVIARCSSSAIKRIAFNKLAEPTPSGTGGPP